MNAGMRESATGQPLPSDGLPAERGYSNGRERAGVVAFVVIAIAATTAWLVLLGWLILQLVRGVF